MIFSAYPLNFSYPDCLAAERNANPSGKVAVRSGSSGNFVGGTGDIALAQPKPTSATSESFANAALPSSAFFPGKLCLRILQYVEQSEIAEREPASESASRDKTIPPETRQVLRACVALFVQIDSVIAKKPVSAAAPLAHLERLMKHLTLYAPQEYQELYEIRLGIQRRVNLLRYAGAALVDLGNEVRLKERTLLDYERFVGKTQSVENYFGQLQDQAVADWRKFLYLDELEDLFDRCADRMEHLGQNEIVPLGERHEICTVASLILECFSVPLSPEQKRFLNQPVMQSWKAELVSWNDNLVHPLRFLALLERYESRELTSDSMTLAETIARLTLSENRNLKTLGRAAKTIYEGPNVRFYLSEVLVNHFMPDRDPEFDRVRETIAGTPVVGRRRTDAMLKVLLQPNPEHLRMTLQVTGTVEALSDAEAKRIRLRSQTRANYLAEKPMEWTTQGIVSGPVEVDVNNNTRLRSIRTRVDGVPLLSGFVKDIARGQYAKQEGQIRLETRAKITQTVRERVDEETGEHLSTFNERYCDVLASLVERNGMNFEQKGASTTEDWLLSSWYLDAYGALGSHTFEPPTPSGAFADLKIHESAFRTALRSLELEGNTFTIGELRELIARKTGFTQFAGNDEYEHLLIAFADKNPIQVHFTDGCVRIHLAIKGMKFRRSVWRDFEFIVQYRPSVDAEGKLCLERQREPWVIGEKNARSQFALRTFVTKLCPANKPFSLVPDFLRHDPRFERLTIGEPRIEKGWCAVAVVGKTEPTLSFEPMSENTEALRERNAGLLRKGVARAKRLQNHSSPPAETEFGTN